MILGKRVDSSSDNHECFLAWHNFQHVPDRRRRAVVKNNKHLSVYHNDYF